jgi:phosphatidylserine synthase
MTLHNFPHGIENKKYVPHYYGDLVRVMFMFAGIVMLVTFPFFSGLIGVPTLLSTLVVIALALMAGLVNPRQKWVLVLNVIVSVIAFLLLEYHAYFAFTYLDNSITLHSVFFWVSQVLALLFFLATYFSMKTVRGRYVDELERTDVK